MGISQFWKKKLIEILVSLRVGFWHIFERFYFGFWITHECDYEYDYLEGWEVFVDWPMILVLNQFEEFHFSFVALKSIHIFF